MNWFRHLIVVFSDSKIIYMVLSCRMNNQELCYIAFPISFSANMLSIYLEETMYLLLVIRGKEMWNSD